MTRSAVPSGKGVAAPSKRGQGSGTPNTFSAKVAARASIASRLRPIRSPNPVTRYRASLTPASDTTLPALTPSFTAARAAIAPKEWPTMLWKRPSLV
jgi:hypothetical protein